MFFPKKNVEFKPELSFYRDNKVIFFFKRMHSLISIVGVFLSSKENYPEWSQKIKHTLIFNELWRGICEGEGDLPPANPTSDKEIIIWENKNCKAYALIAASVNEEVSRHITPFSNAYEALSKLKELYDSNSEL